MQLVLTAVVLSAVGVVHLCSAQLACNGVVSGIINSDVTCNGNCVLDGATVNGNMLCSTGTLLAKGSSSVSGNIQVDGSVTRIELDVVTVSGAVEIKNANSLNEIIIQQAATLTSVTITNTPASIEVSGSLSTIAVTDGGNFVADDLTTIGGVSVSGGNGIVEICGSSIGGVLSVTERTGNINIDTNIANCDPTTLVGGVTIQLGTSAVTIRGANIQNGDIGILQNTGAIVLDQLQVSDLNLEKNMGTLSITGVNTDSDSTIIEHTGDVLLTNVAFIGDAIIKDVEGSVVLADSDISLEDVSITLVTEDVTVDNNIDLNLTVELVQGAVTMTDNTITVASVNKNTGGVDISGNNITTLSCSDNTPAPTGSGNTIGSPDGQCATL